MKIIKVGLVVFLKITNEEKYSNGELSLNEGYPGANAKFSLVYKTAGSEDISEIIHCTDKIIISFDKTDHKYSVRIRLLGEIDDQIIEYVIKTESKKETRSWFKILKKKNFQSDQVQNDKGKKQILFTPKMRKGFSRKKTLEDNIFLVATNHCKSISAISVQICTSSDFDFEEEGTLAYFEIQGDRLALVLGETEPLKTVCWDLDSVCHFGWSENLFLLQIYDEKTDEDRILSFYCPHAEILCKFMLQGCTIEHERLQNNAKKSRLSYHSRALSDSKFYKEMPSSNLKIEMDQPIKRIPIESSTSSNSLISLSEALNVPKDFNISGIFRTRYEQTSESTEKQSSCSAHDS